MHRARAAYFPARALANYCADTAAVRVLGGEARNFDAELYALDVMPNVNRRSITWAFSLDIARRTSRYRGARRAARDISTRISK